MPTVEFFGLPAVGKSTVARELVEELRSRGSLAELPGEGRWSEPLVGLVRRPGIAVRALGAGWMLLRATEGPFRSRMRRALRVTRRLLAVSGTQQRGGWRVYDEGPLNWALASRWRDDLCLDRYLGRVGALYRDLAVQVVVLEAPEARILRQRAQRKSAGGASRALGRERRASRRRRRSIVSWERRLERFGPACRALADSGACVEVVGTGGPPHATAVQVLAVTAVDAPKANRARRSRGSHGHRSEDD